MIIFNISPNIILYSTVSLLDTNIDYIYIYTFKLLWRLLVPQVIEDYKIKTEISKIVIKKLGSLRINKKIDNILISLIPKKYYCN